MTDLVVVVPSRGRPEKARALTQVFRDTCTADTKLVLSLDSDDPTRTDYPIDVAAYIGPNRSMVEALNEAVTAYAPSMSFAVGFMGDDHCPRTYGWDQAYLDALHEMGTGIVYGNDLLQGERLPTQCAMTVDIVQALGFMAPPTLTHLAVDNFWVDLGRAADCIRYLPDVIVEHRHPVAGKAAWDAGYLRVNSEEMYRRDLSEFDRWKRNEMPAAVAKVRALREGVRAVG